MRYNEIVIIFMPCIPDISYRFLISYTLHLLIYFLNLFVYYNVMYKVSFYELYFDKQHKKINRRVIYSSINSKLFFIYYSITSIMLFEHSTIIKYPLMSSVKPWDVSKL